MRHPQGCPCAAGSNCARFGGHPYYPPPGWNRDYYGESNSSFPDSSHTSAGCMARGANENAWCGTTDIATHYVPFPSPRPQPSPPPPSPSPPPPMAVSPSAMTVETSFTLSGDVSNYGFYEINAIKALIAAEVGVQQSAVTVAITAASVHVTATIAVTSTTQAGTGHSTLSTGIMASPAALQAAMQTTSSPVLRTATVEAAYTVCPPGGCNSLPPPPPSLPPSVPSGLSAGTAGGVGAGAVVATVLVLALLGAVVSALLLRRRRLRLVKLRERVESATAAASLYGGRSCSSGSIEVSLGARRSRSQRTAEWGQELGGSAIARAAARGVPSLAPLRAPGPRLFKKPGFSQLEPKTMSEKVAFIASELGLEEGLPVAKVVAAANESLGIVARPDLTMAAQVARLMTELGRSGDGAGRSGNGVDGVEMSRGQSRGPADMKWGVKPDDEIVEALE